MALIGSGCGPAGRVPLHHTSSGQESAGPAGDPRTPGHGLRTRRCQAIAPVTRDFLSSSSILVTITSVVSISPAMLAAFSKADRVTLVGSTIPASNMSTYWAVLALNPRLGFDAPRS